MYLDIHMCKYVPSLKDNKKNVCGHQIIVASVLIDSWILLFLRGGWVDLVLLAPSFVSERINII